MEIKESFSYVITLEDDEAIELFNDLDARADEYKLLPTTQAIYDKLRRRVRSDV